MRLDTSAVMKILSTPSFFILSADAWNTSWSFAVKRRQKEGVIKITNSSDTRNAIARNRNWMK